MIPKTTKVRLLLDLSFLNATISSLKTDLAAVTDFVNGLNEVPEPKKRGRPLGSKNKQGHHAGRPAKTYTHNPQPASFYNLPENLPEWLDAEKREPFLGAAERYLFTDTRTKESVSTYYDNKNALGYYTGPAYFEAYPVNNDAKRYDPTEQAQMYTDIIAELEKRYKTQLAHVLFNPMAKAGNL